MITKARVQVNRVVVGIASYARSFSMHMVVDSCTDLQVRIRRRVRLARRLRGHGDRGLRGSMSIVTGTMYTPLSVSAFPRLWPTYDALYDDFSCL